MVEISVANFVTVGLMALLFEAFWRWLLLMIGPRGKAPARGVERRTVPR